MKEKPQPAETPPLIPKVVRIIGRLVSGPARNACVLHQELGGKFETRLICGSPCAGEHDMGYLLSSEEHVIRLPEMSREISWSDVRALWKIWRILRRERPHVVHTHTAKAGALGRVAAWLAGVPVVVHTYHGHVFHGYFSKRKTAVFLALERQLARITTRIIAISESQREELSGRYAVAPRDKVAVVQNGFYFPRFSSEQREAARRTFGYGPEDFVLVWAGRMAPVKNIQLLGQVVQQAARSSIHARFLVVGDGEERPALEALVLGCGNVRLLGWQRDMEQIWQAADAAILTSRNEGTPTTLIEAMAAGLPFVSTNVGGVADLALGAWTAFPKENGFRVANGFLTDSNAETLLYAAEQLIADREGAYCMGVAGQEFVRERFAANRLVDEMSRLYFGLLGVPQNLTALADPAGTEESSAARAGR